MIATEYCKKVFDGTHDSPKPVENGRLLITSKHIANRSLDISSAYLISEEDFENVNKRSQVHQWDILFSMIGTVGNVYIETSEKIDYAIKNMGVFSCQNKEKAYWLYYYLQSPLVQAKIDALMAGAVQKFVPLGFLRDLDIPEYTENSKKVVQVLSALDDKIALNKKMNQKLKAMAKRLYDYWFVQYDFPDKNGHPYKTTGGPMTYNPTLKREIPVGWDVVQFQDLCTVKRGASPRPIDDFMDELKQGMPWVKISDATSCDSPFLIQIKEFIIKDGISKSVQVKPATLIVSNSASPGIPKFIQIDACVHDGWLVILDYEESYKYYLYYTIQMLRYNLLNMANGSIFKNLKTDYLKEYNCVNPPKEVLKAFHNEIKKYMDLILHIEKETIKLTALRDKLLPLLMNGQVTL